MPGWHLMLTGINDAAMVLKIEVIWLAIKINGI
jgi:hypothetical protein